MASEQTILTLYKKLGETPLECLTRFRKDNPAFAEMKMTYAGRLDPMAEGLLLVLAGSIQESKKKELLSYDKTYEFEVLWGFETDTYDTLGMVTKVGSEPLRKFDTKLPKLLSEIQNKKTQEYPPYSSRTVDGKSLFEYARAGTIKEIDIPTRQIKIFTLEHIHTREVSQKEILKTIEERVAHVHGDFRQQEILGSWKHSINQKETALVSLLRASVSSGTYIRSLTHAMGEKLECGAIAYSIKRTRVGPYTLDDVTI